MNSKSNNKTIVFRQDPVLKTFKDMLDASGIKVNNKTEKRYYAGLQGSRNLAKVTQFLIDRGFVFS